MLSHVFSHDGATYIVSFRQVDGQWLAALYRRGDDFVRPLFRFTEEEVGQFSDDAIRAGYIAVAKWVANGGMWGEWAPDEEGEPEQVKELIAA